MRRSLKFQLIALFLGGMILIFAGVIAANSLFLEIYYTKTTEKQLISLYDRLDQAAQGDLLDSSTFIDEMRRECEAANTAVAALYHGKEYGFSDMMSIRFMKERLFQLFMNGQTDHSDPVPNETGDERGFFGETFEVRAQTDAYTIVHCKEQNSGSGYLEMWGFLADNGVFVMRTPLESISRSASVANRFMLGIGMAAVLAGTLILLLFARRLTRPIEELTVLSDRMADLDFEAKYIGTANSGSTEIAVLGDNFNRMSISLESAVRDLKTANLTLQKDLADKEAAEIRRKEFLDNVSHELKTPLAVIEGYAEGLQSVLGEDPKKREEYSRIILEESHKMTHMLKNLLNLSELETGSTQMKRFDLMEIIDGVTAACQRNAEQENISLLCEKGKELYVWGDPYGIETVLQNYLTNAIRYASGEEKMIRISMQESENKVRINVFNSGEPIPQEHLARIWEKFYKIDKVRSRSKGGTGLGLSIVKAIMEQHGEAYGVQNEADGVTFWFELNCK